MTKLPKASKISSLTNDNIMLVAEEYLQQLSEKRTGNREDATKFVWEALLMFRNLGEHAAYTQQFMAKSFELVLRRTPNVTLPLQNEASLDAINHWAQQNGIGFEYIPFSEQDIFVFDNHDDSLLFKLRWG
jgi:hypothetical protein